LERGGTQDCARVGAHKYRAAGRRGRAQAPFSKPQATDEGAPQWSR